MTTAGIDTYDPDCVHNFGEHRIAFDANEFRPSGGGRLELWKGNEYCGIVKGFLAVGLDSLERLLNHVPRSRHVKWLVLLDRVFPEPGHQVALYAASFEMAKRLGAAGIASEWDQSESKRLWSELAPKFNATLEERQSMVGKLTSNPQNVPIYIALFPEAKTASA